MKKSFKKAGAAVLSMAMLLSMGAVSLPVYAVDPPQPWPGQVAVTIDPTSTWADEDGRTFSYLSGVKDATVRIYRVATHSGAGWNWDTAFRSSEIWRNNNTPNTTTTPLTDFENLLAVDANGDFTATSDELMKLASALERVVMDSNGEFNSTPVALAEQKLDSTTGTTTILLPPDDELDTDTKDIVGYYLISTVTDDAGVMIQPALISLKNSKTGDEQLNPVPVTLKGNNINVDKEITTVKDTTKEKSLVSGGSISTSKDTAVASEHDTVAFTIKTQLPKYDVNLAPSALHAVTLTDTPDAGVNILTGNASETAVNNLKVYAGTTAGAENNLLQENTDYTVTVNDQTGGFTITFVQGALRYGSGAEGQTEKASTADKLEGQFIKVTFDGVVDDDIKKGVATTSTFTDLTVAQINAMLGRANSLKMTSTESGSKYATLLATVDATAVTAIKEKLGIPPTGTGARDLTNDEKVAAALALEKLNTAGDENIAKLTYGNEYSTGQNETSREDRVKLFSVDLNLTKIADQLLIDRNMQDDGVTPSNPQGYTEAEETAATKKYVQGAVLELKKLDDTESGANAVSGASSYGLAITDANGKLHMLQRNDSTETPDYTDGNGVKYTVNASDNAWDNLTVGNYLLEEVKAPTGYKKFDPITITISCAKTDNEYNGVFSATTSVAEGKVNQIATEGNVLSFAGTNAQVTTLQGTLGAANVGLGDLVAELKDPIADTLPATGGIGTVLFTAGGISIVLIAGALFVMYMKKRDTDEE